MWPVGDTERVIAHVAPDALALAETQGDRTRTFRAYRLALDCLYALQLVQRSEHSSFVVAAFIRSRPPLLHYLMVGEVETQFIHDPGA
jgi:hypothetical protein